MNNRFLTVALAVSLFAGGFAGGFLFRGAPPNAPARMTQQPGTQSAGAHTTSDESTRPERNEVSAQGEGAADPTVADEDERRPAQVFADLEAAVADSDPDDVHEALEDLAQPGKPLSAEEIESLGSLLDTLDGDGIEEAAHALVRNGGLAGFKIVLAFASDAQRSVEDRRRALDSIDNAPPELAEQLLPAIVEFMESEQPRELQFTAAHALGRLMGEQSVDTLLGLLENQSAVGHDVIFNAIAATGSGEDADTLLGLLSGDVDGQSRRGLLRALGEISIREGNSDLLFDLLQTATDRQSLEIIAEAIADSSQRLNLSALRLAIELTAGGGWAQDEIATALARHGSRAGLEVLFDAMNDPNVALDERALAGALREYEGRDGVPFMFDFMQSSRDSEALEVVAFGIARNGDSASIDELVTMLEVGSDQQRMAVASALREVSPGALSLDGLLDRLSAEADPEIGSELAGSIEALYGTEGLQRVADVLNGTTNAERRQAMLWGLEDSWEHNPAQARELYVRLAGLDPDPGVRQEAIEIMEEQDDPSLIPSLQQLFDAEFDPEVRERLNDAILELESQR